MSIRVLELLIKVHRSSSKLLAHRLAWVEAKPKNCAFITYELLLVNINQLILAGPVLWHKFSLCYFYAA